LSEHTRQAIEHYLKAADKTPGDFLFTDRRGANSSMIIRQYAHLASEWMGSVRLNPRPFGTHSLRRRNLGVAERLNNPETIRHLRRERANELENRHRHNRLRDQTGSMIVSGIAVLENVRKYRAIASLYRQTASFRPPQRLSLLEQAKDWERLALAELESYFSTPRGSKYLREQ
jgi:hypothetical protein